MWHLAAFLGLVLAFIYVCFLAWDTFFGKKTYEDVEHDHPWNKFIKPRPVRLDEFAGELAGQCGQVRPGEWQCNCADQTKPCIVLVTMKSQVDAVKEEVVGERTNRRAAIAAQKARKQRGN